MPASPRGAYGLSVSSPLREHPALRDLADPTGHLDLTEVAAPDAPSFALDPGRVQIVLADGSQLDAQDLGDGCYRASLGGGPAKTLDELVHPYLAPIAALVHRWRGVPALHGAALGSPLGALGLLGVRESGKSTTAAALVAAGLSLLSDDLIVVGQGRILPGPLSVDLRPAGAALLGLSGEPVRGGDRLRRLATELDMGPAATDLRVLVQLEFGPVTRIRPVPAGERLAALAPHLYWPGLGHPARDLLALAAVPQVVLERPRGEAGLTAAVSALLGLIHPNTGVWEQLL